MIIVSDTSPINNLAAIHQLHLLQQLYETILIPDAVYRELTDPEFPVAGGTEVRDFDWIQTRTVRDRDLVRSLREELDPGEAEAIALAVETSADRLLVDERRGRSIAERFDLQYTGLLGVLVEAKDRGFIPAVRPLLDALRNDAGFWIADPLYQYVLQAVCEAD